jgi:hypothetical protein
MAKRQTKQIMKVHKDKVSAMRDVAQKRIGEIHRKGRSIGFQACANTVLKPSEKRGNSTKQNDARSRIFIGFSRVAPPSKDPGIPFITPRSMVRFHPSLPKPASIYISIISSNNGKAVRRQVPAVFRPLLQPKFHGRTRAIEIRCFKIPCLTNGNYYTSGPAQSERPKVRSGRIAIGVENPKRSKLDATANRP